MMARIGHRMEKYNFRYVINVWHSGAESSRIYTLGEDLSLFLVWLSKTSNNNIGGSIFKEVYDRSPLSLWWGVEGVGGGEDAWRNVPSCHSEKWRLQDRPFFGREMVVRRTLYQLTWIKLSALGSFIIFERPPSSSLIHPLHSQS